MWAVQSIPNFVLPEGPWKNKMKAVAEATRAMKRMDLSNIFAAAKPPLPTDAKKSSDSSLQHARQQPDLEIEVDDTESVASEAASVRKGTSACPRILYILISCAVFLHCAIISCDNQLIYLSMDVQFVIVNMRGYNYVSLVHTLHKITLEAVGILRSIIYGTYNGMHCDTKCTQI